MNSVKTASVALCMCVLLHAGCEQLHEKPPSAEAAACRARIAAFRSGVGLDGVKLQHESNRICEQMLSLTNIEERIMLFREFTEELYKIDISRCSPREATYMLGNNNYYRVVEYLAHDLIRAGGSKEAAWQILMMGLEKYRQMCFAYGDENDTSDGFSREAFYRRKVAQWGPEYWKCCLLFCRDNTIKSIFGSDKKTVEQFQIRLQEKFNMEK